MTEMTAEETKREVAHLTSLRESLLIQMKDVSSALEKFRVKCPTCRCRILPGEACVCCADDPRLTDGAAFVSEDYAAGLEASLRVLEDERSRHIISTSNYAMVSECIQLVVMLLPPKAG